LLIAGLAFATVACPRPDRARRDAGASAAPTSVGGSSASGSAVAPTATSAPTTTARAAQTGVPSTSPAGLSHALVWKLCHEQRCANDHASIEVWRGADKRVGLLRFNGSVSACKQPPSVFVDWRGKPVIELAGRPAGRDEAMRVQRELAKTTRGLRGSEVIRCFGVRTGSWVPEPRGKPLSVAQLQSGERVPGSYLVAAVVTKSVNCPPCQPGDLKCTPCQGGHIELGDRRDDGPDSIIKAHFGAADGKFKGPKSQFFEPGKPHEWLLERRAEGGSDFTLLRVVK
jgi:hypothetical protein